MLVLLGRNMAAEFTQQSTSRGEAVKQLLKAQTEQSKIITSQFEALCLIILEVSPEGLEQLDDDTKRRCKNLGLTQTSDNGQSDTATEQPVVAVEEPPKALEAPPVQSNDQVIRPQSRPQPDHPKNKKDGLPGKRVGLVERILNGLIPGFLR